ncbi:MAG: zinc-ribbon and DUF3426 domain-containing protein [Rhodanobacter sp.]|jgi:predicted Zn finger-like uncharacterized protein|nr:zinc-ribbon and DUF3426 domain-containing protein [Rhodanobacter sp.]
MYTQCPECQTVFSLDVNLLAQARGYVGCGYCSIEFDALASLAEQLPPEPFRLLPTQPESHQLPTLELAVYRPQPEPVAVLEAEIRVADNHDTEDFSQLVFAPRFVREQHAQEPARLRKRKPRRPASGELQWPWAAACLLLILLLSGQLAWAERGPLIRNPVMGHWLRSTCTALGCQLPLIAAPQKLRLVASNVQAHPSVPDALMISASVRNDAAFAQPYPVLEITLSDARGRPVAMRRLQPRDYLDDDAALRRGLAPGGSTVLLIEAKDPGEKAVAFDFSFE